MNSPAAGRRYPQWFRYVPVVSDALPEDAWDGRTGFVHRAVMGTSDLSGYQGLRPVRQWWWIPRTS